MTFTNFKNKYLSLVIALSIVLLSGYFQKKIRIINTQASQEVKSKYIFAALKIQPKIIKRLLGVRLMVSDLLLIDMLIHWDIEREKKNYTDYYFAAKNVVDLDKDHLFAYFLFGTQLSVIKGDAKGATTLLREGVKNFLQIIAKYNLEESAITLNLWKIYFLLGYNLMFEEFEFDEGVHWIIESSKLKNAQSYVTQFADELKTDSGRFKVMTNILNTMYRITEDSSAKDEIKKKLFELACKYELIELNNSFSDYLKRTGSLFFNKKVAFRRFIRTQNLSKSLCGTQFELDQEGKIISKE